MNRRTFLKIIGAGLAAAVTPEILLPSTKTIIDMNPQSYKHVLTPRDTYRYVAIVKELHAQGLISTRLTLEELFKVPATDLFAKRGMIAEKHAIEHRVLFPAQKVRYHFDFYRYDWMEKTPRPEGVNEVVVWRIEDCR